MHLCAEEGPRAGRRLAAVNYVMDNSGSPPPGGWDSAAKSLGFVAPSSVVRPISRGAPVPISSVSEDEKFRKPCDKDKDTNIDMHCTQEP